MNLVAGADLPACVAAVPELGTAHQPVHSPSGCRLFAGFPPHADSIRMRLMSVPLPLHSVLTTERALKVADAALDTRAFLRIH